MWGSTCLVQFVGIRCNLGKFRPPHIPSSNILLKQAHVQFFFPAPSHLMELVSILAAYRKIRDIDKVMACKTYVRLPFQVSELDFLIFIDRVSTATLLNASTPQATLDSVATYAPWSTPPTWRSGSLCPLSLFTATGSGRWDLETSPEHLAISKKRNIKQYP